MFQNKMKREEGKEMPDLFRIWGIILIENWATNYFFCTMINFKYCRKIMNLSIHMHKSFDSQFCIRRVYCHMLPNHNVEFLDQNANFIIQKQLLSFFFVILMQDILQSPIFILIKDVYDSPKRSCYLTLNACLVDYQKFWNNFKEWRKECF